LQEREQRNRALRCCENGVQPADAPFGAAHAPPRSAAFAADEVLAPNLAAAPRFDAAPGSPIGPRAGRTPRHASGRSFDAAPGSPIAPRGASGPLVLLPAASEPAVRTPFPSLFFATFQLVIVPCLTLCGKITDACVQLHRAAEGQEG
jgi:hypothetical protein